MFQLLNLLLKILTYHDIIISNKKQIKFTVQGNYDCSNKPLSKLKS
jgi:hypothetical protein